MANAAVELADMDACKDHEIQLRYVKKEGDIEWYHGSEKLPGENPTVRISQDEIYTATAFNECTSATTFLHVTMLPLPFIAVTPDTSICYGKSLDFNSCIKGIPIDMVTWSPSRAENLTEPGMYTATATTEKCGSTTASMYVNVYKPLILLPNDSHLPRYNRKDFYDVSFQTLQAENPVSYSIGMVSPNKEMPSWLNVENGHISGKPVLGLYDYKTHHLQVSVTDEHKCSMSKEYLLAPEWKAPTVLLPRGDADNAVFLRDYPLTVYDRNGLLIYKGKGWNGMWNGTYVPAGTYFYKVTILMDEIPEERMSYVVVMYY
jgi:hypothetical protein